MEWSLGKKGIKHLNKVSMMNAYQIDQMISLTHKGGTEETCLQGPF